MIFGHGGNVAALAVRLGVAATEIVDMSSNVNPLGPPEGLVDYLKREMSIIRRLPEADAGSTVHRMADFLGCTPDGVMAGNGTTELIYRIPRALSPRHVLIVGPTYADYADACRQNGIEPRWLSSREETGFETDLDQLAIAAETADMVFICNPNNPTGRLTDPAAIDDLCRRLPDTCFVVDESYLPFAAPAASLSRRQRPNLVVLHSLSKIFTLPGLRIGFLTAHPDVISRLRRYDTPWSMNGMAAAAVDYLMTHRVKTAAFVNESAASLAAERRRFMDALAPLNGIAPIESRTSFILMALNGGLTAGDVCRRLGDQRVLIRNCSNFHGLTDRFIRISMKTAEDNQRCIDLLTAVLGDA
jgi:threonine-phosphate decarboxylase